MSRLAAPLLTATLFSIAMAALEAIVVVYLRQLYYPDGFTFPLIRLSETAMGYEWLREATTIIMLATAAMMVSAEKQLRFAWFLFLFAIWDIWYYIWLKILLGWPASLFTWDILFLIPVPWLGPVLAPVLCSLAMVFYAWVLFKHSVKGLVVRYSRLHKLLMGLGILLILFTFMYNYGSLVMQTGLNGETNPEESLMNALSGYIPTFFNWPVFLAGMVCILLPLLNSLTTLYKQKPSTS
jgi:hypothetical protein